MKTSVFTTALLSAAGALAQISNSDYAAIQKYTAFAAASYAENCPTPPSGAKIIKFFNNTATDTQAYLFQAGSEKILSFRGSSSPKDLDTDLNFTLTGVAIPGVNCGSCQVHAGFQTALLSIFNDVKSAIGGTSGSGLTITGHSLGGGLAALAAVALKPGKVYTFGEPRNGNAAWSALVDKTVSPANYFRVTHYNDGVPQIPPTGLSFLHHGTEYWQSKASGNSASTTKKCAAATGQENASCNKAQNYGNAPINGAHILYTDLVVASMLFNPGCGYKH